MDCRILYTIVAVVNASDRLQYNIIINDMNFILYNYPRLSHAVVNQILSRTL